MSGAAVEDPAGLLTEEAADWLVEPAEIRRFAVGAAQHGWRLDQALAEAVPEFSRSYLQQLIAQGLVQVQGKPATKPALRVKVGESLQLEMRPTLQSQAFRPENLPLDIVYEDAHLCIVNKAPGMVVHPAPGNWGGTLLNALLARDPKAALVPRAGIVHRLDKDTSGLMVVARTRSAMDALVAMIAARTVSRKYLALGHGAWRGGPRTVEAAIGRDPRNRLRMAVVDLARGESGKPARTDIECLGTTDQACWVRCTLHTGRTHQIRVHMAQLGHPLLADALYGGQPAFGMQRQALHAYRLAFAHPVTGDALDVRSPLPDDMQAVLAAWGLGYNPASFE